jgi:hypothetical protein
VLDAKIYVRFFDALSRPFFLQIDSVLLYVNKALAIISVQYLLEWKEAVIKSGKELLTLQFLFDIDITLQYNV